MEVATEPREAVAQNGRPTADPRPLAEYASLMAVYNTGLAGYLWWRRGRLPKRIGAGDLALLGIAAHKLSRLIAKDKVTAPLRAPFTEYEGEAGPSEVSEKPVGTGAREAVGELIACPFCLDQWVATGLAVGLVEAPRATRFVMAIFAGVAASDFLQIAYKVAESKLDR